MEATIITADRVQGVIRALQDKKARSPKTSVPLSSLNVGDRQTLSQTVDYLQSTGDVVRTDLNTYYLRPGARRKARPYMIGTVVAIAAVLAVAGLVQIL